LNWYSAGTIDLVSNGVLVSGRYGHGKPRKPVNTAFATLHSFESYIIFCAFKGIFTLARAQTVVPL